jgi:putative Ca2+/H+ antiporter (TMEM165/GDT1 family)
VLSAKYRKPWPILTGAFIAILANHLLAGAVGVWLGRYLSPFALNTTVGVSMLIMAAWTLLPERISSETGPTRRGAFLTALFAVFVTEFGDKTQIATVALAAGYANLFAIVVGTSAGMLAADLPVVFLGNAFAARLPLKAIRCVAFGLFAALGVYFITKSTAH